MATASLGKLEVTFSGDTTNLDAAANKAKQSMKGAGQASAQMASSVTGSFLRMGAAVAAAAAIIHSSATAMADAAKSAQSLGLAVESFTALSFAARTAGVSAESLDTSIKQLSQRLTNVDPMSDTTRALQALGLAYEFGTTKGMQIESTLLAVADKFSKTKDGVNKTAIAMALFGEQGAKLIPLLNKGAGGINELMAEAGRLGITMSGEASKASIEYAEKLETVKAIVAGVAKSMTNELLPSINSAMASFIEFAKENEAVKAAGILTSATITGLKLTFEALALPVRIASNLFTSLFKSLSLAALGQFSAAWEELSGVVGGVQTEISNSAGNIAVALGVVKGATDGVTNSWNNLSVEVAKREMPAIASAYEMNKALEERRKLYASMQQTILQDRTLTEADKIARLSDMARKGQIEFQAFITTVRSLGDEQTQRALAFIKDEKTLPVADRLRELKILFDEGKLSVHEYGDAMKSVNDSGRDSMNDLVSASSSALTQIFEGNKTAAIASALINTFQGITKAIASYPPPISYAMAGIQAALGFAQVNKIRSTNKSGGGGGGGATPSAAAATAATAATPAAQESTLTVRGLSMNGLFTGEAVRDLASKLLDFQRDGGRVVLAGA